MPRPLCVFLCHASQDKPAVRELYNALKSEGWIDPWLDKAKILPGQDWEMVIEKAVDSSDVVVICLSNQSVTKEGFVQREIRYAYDLALEKPEDTIFLIPLRLDDCPVPRKLRTFHWVNYFGAQKQEAYADLLEALRLRYDQKLKLEAQEEERGWADRQVEQRAEDLARRLAAEKSRLEGTEQEQREWDAAEKEEPARRNIENHGRSHEMAIRKVQNILPKLKIPALALVISIVGYFLWQGISSISMHSDPSPTPTTIVVTNTFLLPTKIKTPTPTKAVPTETIIATPPLGIGSLFDSDGVPMLYVPAGTFSMGSETYTNEENIHPVNLDAYYMDKYEVTNVAYKRCVDAGVCDAPKKSNSNTRSAYYSNPEFDEYPVIYVDWGMAKTYCQWRGVRLPTEAEWEKAARGTDGRTYPWGEDINCSKANYYDDSQYCVGDTKKVGSYLDGVSPYGMYDLAGNVWEWVNDWYSGTYYRNSPLSNPLGPDTGQSYVLRGGSWVSYDYGVRAAVRKGGTPLNNDYVTGFRCARSAE